MVYGDRTAPWQKPLPTMYDLPSEDPEEPGLPDEFHDLQPALLSQTCQPAEYWPDRCFTATDLNLYYDSRHTLWHKRPDWFLVLDNTPSTDQETLRWSYVIWQEGVIPYLVVELLSPGTETEDLGLTQRKLGKPPTKWEVYEQILHIPYYVVYDRYQNRLRAFRLQGARYQEQLLPDRRIWFNELNLGLGLWQGIYDRREGLWLRWYDAQGNWIPTPSEQLQERDEELEQKEQELEQQRQRAQDAEQKAEQLAAYIKSLGLNPDEINPPDKDQ